MSLCTYRGGLNTVLLNCYNIYDYFVIDYNNVDDVISFKDFDVKLCDNFTPPVNEPVFFVQHKNLLFTSGALWLCVLAPRLLELLWDLPVHIMRITPVHIIQTTQCH